MWFHLIFHRFIVGKVKVDLFLYDFRYFDKSITVIFFEKSSNNHVNVDRYPPSVRPSTFSNDISSLAIKPILMKFGIKHQ